MQCEKRRDKQSSHLRHLRHLRPSVFRLARCEGVDGSFLVRVVVVGEGFFVPPPFAGGCGGGSPRKKGEI